MAACSKSPILLSKMPSPFRRSTIIFTFLFFKYLSYRCLYSCKILFWLFLICQSYDQKMFFPIFWHSPIHNPQGLKRNVQIQNFLLWKSQQTPINRIRQQKLKYITWWFSTIWESCEKLAKSLLRAERQAIVPQVW